jgi:hypothetical protein
LDPFHVTLKPLLIGYTCHASLTNLAQKVVLHSTSYQQEGQKVVNVEADDWYMKIHCNHVQIEIILKKIKVLMLINVMADF